MRSLSLKVALPLAAASAIVTIAGAVVGSSYRVREVAQDARFRARTLISVTLGSLNAATTEGHRPSVQPLLDRLARDREILAIRIIRPDGVVARATNPADVGRNLAAEVAKVPAGNVGLESENAGGAGAFVRATRRIPNEAFCRDCHAGKAHLGYMDVVLSMSGPGTELGHWRRVETLTGTLQVLALLALTGIVTSVLVVRPVRRLAAAMERAKSGDLEVRCEPEGTREIDAVIDGFNTMVFRLAEASRAERDAQRRQMERAEHLAAVGEMAAGLAHEIRNPLAGVKAAVEVLARQTTDEQCRSILGLSVVELNRVEEVIRNLLNYARPRPADRVPADLNQIVRDGIALIGARAASLGIEVRCALAPQLPPVHVDPPMVRQVVTNLVLNAIQALEGRDQGVVEVATLQTGDEVWARVRDNGPGIALSEAESIFRPFFTTKTRGTGLGLSISSRLIELQGGRLRLENAGRPGASFVFTLPRLAGDTGALERQPL